MTPRDLADALDARARTHRDSRPTNDADRLLTEAARALRDAEALAGVMSDLAEQDCEYGDGCPAFGSRHGRCVGCVAREALAAFRRGAGGKCSECRKCERCERLGKDTKADVNDCGHMLCRACAKKVNAAVNARPVYCHECGRDGTLRGAGGER